MGSLELPRTGNENALKLSSEQSGWLWKKPVVWWAITENPRRCFRRHCRCPVDFGWLPSSHRSAFHCSRRHHRRPLPHQTRSVDPATASSSLPSSAFEMQHLRKPLWMTAGSKSIHVARIHCATSTRVGCHIRPPGVKVWLPSESQLFHMPRSASFIGLFTLTSSGCRSLVILPGMITRSVFMSRSSDLMDGIRWQLNESSTNIAFLRSRPPGRVAAPFWSSRGLEPCPSIRSDGLERGYLVEIAFPWEGSCVWRRCMVAACHHQPYMPTWLW